MKIGGVTARFTSDGKGETLSLQFGNDIMIGVPFEKITGLIEEERKKNHESGNANRKTH